MLGAIIGDVVGSIYEFRPVADRGFTLLTPDSTFTDDTVCTIAVADHLLTGTDIAVSLRTWGRRYIDAGYGSGFKAWLLDETAGRRNSYGNGAPMRISPCAHLCPTEAAALEAARRVTAPTHDHPEAHRAAAAVTAAIRAAYATGDAERVRQAVASHGYRLDRSLAEIRVGFGYDLSAAGTVPPALTAALEATSFVDAIRNAVWLNGDSDTIACIAGSVAEGLFEIPPKLAAAVIERLPADMRAVLEAVRSRSLLTARPGPMARLAAWWRG